MLDMLSSSPIDGLFWVASKNTQAPSCCLQYDVIEVNCSPTLRPNHTTELYGLNHLSPNKAHSAGKFFCQFLPQTILLFFMIGLWQQEHEVAAHFWRMVHISVIFTILRSSLHLKLHHHSFIPRSHQSSMQGI